MNAWTGWEDDDPDLGTRVLSVGLTLFTLVAAIAVAVVGVGWLALRFTL